MKLNQITLAVFILLIFYTVGIIGLSLDKTFPLFITLTPFQLLLTLAILVWVNKDFSGTFILAFIIIFMIGFWVEVAGVKTGVLFGHYQYGDPLGVKILQVPLMIGINWFILGLSSKGLISTLKIKPWLQIILAALMMVGIDFLIEPVAIKLDFWQWQNNMIPIRNYLMWFITAISIQLIIHMMIKKINKAAASAVFLIQVYFFLLMNITLQ